MRRTVGALLASIALAAAACTAEDVADIGTTDVVEAEVVQTIAAAAELEPAARATVSAPLGGEVAELLVADGDIVAPGDPVVRLASDSIDQQVSQAEAAVEAAESLGNAATAGFDLSPLLGAFRSQLDAVFPPVIAALDQQVDALEATADKLAAAQLPKVDGSAAMPSDTDVIDDTAIAEALADARIRVAELEAGYLDARASLDQAEDEAAQQASAAAAGQRAAAEAQIDQATLALQTARARVEDLTVVAPVAGVVELARADAAGGGSADLPVLPEGQDDALSELSGLLEGESGGATTLGPLAEGVGVSAGQPLMTIFDLSGFTARVLVDELDVVDVELGQRAIVLVDAFPDAELPGEVTYIALEPEPQAAGGAVYPVTVTLSDVPSDVALRVGLTASAEIEIRRVESETVVPTSALLRRDADEVVHVVRDGIAHEIPVRIVAIGEDTAAVEGDLVAGEPVVSTGLEFVEDGTPVTTSGS